MIAKISFTPLNKNDSKTKIPKNNSPGFNETD